MYKETLKAIWIELALGFVIYLIDFRFFVFYAFCSLVFIVVWNCNYLGKLIRVFNTGTEAKLIAIMKKLKMTDEEIKRYGEEYMNEQKELVGEKAWEGVEKDFRDIQKK